MHELYRQMFNRELYLLAYGNIYSNKGAMTPGPAGKPLTACPRARSAASSCDAAERYRFPRPPGLHSEERTGVRHEAHCCIARAAGRDERRYLWI